MNELKVVGIQSRTSKNGKPFMWIYYENEAKRDDLVGVITGRDMVYPNQVNGDLKVGKKIRIYRNSYANADGTVGVQMIEVING